MLLRYRMASILLAVAPFTPAAWAAQKQLLYAVDFDSDTIGQPPATGSRPAPARVLSDILFGDPTVVASHGPLGDQPCRFGNGTTGYDQILLDLTPYRYAVRPPYLTYERFECDFDLVVSHVVDRFTVHFSGIGVYSISFLPDGSVQAFTARGTVVLGVYVPGARMHVRVVVDLRPSEKSLALWLDGVASPRVSAARLDLVPPRLSRLRWNLVGADPAESVALDDIKVFGEGGSPAPDLGYGSEGGPALSVSSSISLDLHCAPPSAPVALILSDRAAPIPFLGATLLPDPIRGAVVTVTSDVEGSWWLTLPSGTGVGAPLYLQAAVLRAVPFEALFSNAIQVGG